MTLSTLRPTPRQQSESPESAEAFTQRLADLTRTLAETAEQYDISAQFPHANFRLLHSHGLLGLTVPAELGGALPTCRGRSRSSAQWPEASLRQR